MELQKSKVDGFILVVNNFLTVIVIYNISRSYNLIPYKIQTSLNRIFTKTLVILNKEDE